MLWCSEFHTNVGKNLLTATNLTDTLTNSDLELAGIIMGMLLATSAPTRHMPHVMVASDNVPAVSWLQKGSNSSAVSLAFLLYQLARQCRTQPFTYTPVFTPGQSNQLADCRFCLFHFFDKEFLEHMNQMFPVQPCWQLARCYQT